MTAETDRWIDLATKPLAGKTTIRQNAADLLLENLQTGGASAEDLGKAAGVLEKADLRSGWKFWRHVFPVLTLVAILVIAAWTLGHLRQAATQVRLTSNPMLPSDSEGSAPVRKNLSEAQQQLLFGDSQSAGTENQWRKLWLENPGNPEYLAQHAAEYARRRNGLNPEILDAASRVDAGNAWYPLMSENPPTDSIVRKKSRGWMNKNPREAPVWEIVDRDKLKRLLESIHRAAGMNRLTRYETENLARKIPLLPARVDWASQFPRVTYVISSQAASTPIPRVVAAISAEAQECAKRGDVGGFRILVDDWRKLCRIATGERQSLLDQMYARALFQGPLRNFRDAAKNLGLEEQSSHFARWDEILRQDSEARKKSEELGRMGDLFSSKGSYFTHLTLPVISMQTAASPKVSEADLSPARHADFAAFVRFSTWPMWFLLGCCLAIVFASVILKKPAIRALSLRFSGLMGAGDLAWVSAGALVPMLYYLAISHFTPLGAPQWALRWSGFIVPAIQLGNLAIMMILLPWLIAGWRLKRWNPLFGSPGILVKTGWCAVVCCALAIPAGGTLYLGIRLWPAILLTCLPLVWLAALITVGFLKRKRNHLRCAVQARLAAHGWIAGMFLLAAWCPPYYAWERKSIQLDRILEISEQAPASSWYEYETARAIQEEMLGKLEQEAAGE